jgi:8-oxo-dGTP pyrophosphatase MutT (NUDIX family)
MFPRMKVSTSAGGVVLNSKGQVLVVNQRGRSWSLPKGHLEEGEEPLAAAKREIYEETGIKNLELIKELGTYLRHKIGLDGKDDLSEIKTLTFFLFRTTSRKLQPKDPDNPEARWVDPDGVAPLLTHPKDREFFAAIRVELEKVS